MLTFCEVKNMLPFPELLFSFMGIVNELKVAVMGNSQQRVHPLHIAPSLMISGKPSSPVSRIQGSLEGRYAINIFFDLFYSSVGTFSKANLNNIRVLESKPFAKRKTLGVFQDDEFPF